MNAADQRCETCGETEFDEGGALREQHFVIFVRADEGHLFKPSIVEPVVNSQCEACGGEGDVPCDCANCYERSEAGVPGYPERMVCMACEGLGERPVVNPIADPQPTSLRQIYEAHLRGEVSFADVAVESERVIARHEGREFTSTQEIELRSALGTVEERQSQPTSVDGETR